MGWSSVGGRRDRGAGAVEYIAVTLVIAVVTATIVVSGVGGIVSNEVCNAVGKIVSKECAPVALNAPTPGGSQAPSAPPTMDRDDYVDLMCQDAGVDCDAWDPNRGVSCNDQNIRSVYDYYGRMSQEHPELQWMGLARLVGGVVYAGMQDIHVLRAMTYQARREFLQRLGMPAQLLDALAGMTEEEFEYFEDKLVSMEKQIFLDIGWQNAAYVHGGIEEMRRLDAEGQLAPGMLDAWEDIASGDPERIRRGTSDLAYREQNIVIQDDYDDMKGHHGLVGLAVTYLLSLTAQNPVPGGEPFRDVVNTRISTPDQACVPFTNICADIPSVGVEIPTKNLADFDSRWQWVTDSIMPSYEDLRRDEDDFRRWIDMPLGERAEDLRLVPAWLVHYNPRDGIC